MAHASKNSLPRKRREKKRAKRRARAPKKGKRYSKDFKKECLKLLAEGMTMSALEQLRGVSAMTLWRWTKEEERKKKAFRNQDAEATSEGTGCAACGEELDVQGSEDVGEEGSAQQKSRAPHDNIEGVSDNEVSEIIKLKKDHPAMGPAQIRAQLKRFRGWRIGVRSIARVLKKNGYRVEHRSAREDKAVQRFEAPYPNDLWMMDALSFRVHELKLYLHLVIDDFSRFIVGHRMSEQVTSDEAVATLKEAIEKHGKPQRLLTDRGSQFLAVRKETSFRRFLEKELIDHSVSRPYHPQTLGKVESINRAIQKELIYVREFASAAETKTAIDDWVDRFNFRRAHMGIDGLTPADRYFGLHRRVLAEVQARSRRRQSQASLDSPIPGPVDDMTGVLEVLRLVLVDDQIELRFCGARVGLGPVTS